MYQRTLMPLCLRTCCLKDQHSHNPSEEPDWGLPGCPAKRHRHGNGLWLRQKKCPEFCGHLQSVTFQLSLLALWDPSLLVPSQQGSSIQGSLMKGPRPLLGMASGSSVQVGSRAKAGNVVGCVRSWGTPCETSVPCLGTAPAPPSPRPLWYYFMDLCWNHMVSPGELPHSRYPLPPSSPMRVQCAIRFYFSKIA